MIRQTHTVLVLAGGKENPKTRIRDIYGKKFLGTSEIAKLPSTLDPLKLLGNLTNHNTAAHNQKASSSKFKGNIYI